MNCILLLLLLGCCGNSDNGGNRSGCGCNGTSAFNDRYGYGGASPVNDGCGCQGNVSPVNDGCGCQGNVSPVSDNCGCQENVSPVNDGCGCQGSVSPVNDDCGCGQDGGFRSAVSGQNPPGWQNFPEIPRRDNDCGCNN